MVPPHTVALQVAFDKSGKVQALDCKLYNNAGNGLDLSAAIMDRALLHIDAAYKIPNVRVVGHCCKTNISSNTAFRGFGGPQASMLLRTWTAALPIKARAMYRLCI